MIQLDLTAPLQSVTSAFDSLSTYVYGVAFLLTLIGYYAQVWRRRGEPAKTLEALGLIAICVLFAASVSFWRPYVVNLFYFPAQQLAQASSLFQLNQAMNHFYSGMSALTAGSQVQNQTTGAIQQAAHLLWNFSEITLAALFGLIAQALVFVLSIVAAILALPFYVFQQVLVTVFFAFMPIAICALPVPVLRDRAVTFMATTASVLAWPLGFSIVAAATNVVFQIPLNPSASVPNAVASILLPIIQILMAAVVMIFGTLLVPPTMYFIAAHGGTHIDPVMSAVRSVPMLGGLGKR